MLAMRDLTDKHKLSVRSIGEVHEAVNGVLYRYKTTGEVQFRGKITRESLVNAIILHFDSLSAEDKARALRVGVARLSAILDTAGGITPPPGRITVTPKGSPPPKRRKNSTG